MNSIIDRLNLTGQKIAENLKGSAILDWTNILEKSILPDFVQSIIAKRVGFIFLNDPELFKTEACHEFAVRQLRSDDRQLKYVTGTMDASTDEDYKNLYEKNGWKTAVYFYLNLAESPIPANTGAFNKILYFSVPVLFYSNISNAINESDFELLAAFTTSVALAMLLKFGFTWTGTQANKIWDALPGAAGVISSDYIFLKNQEFDRIFNLTQKPANYIALEDALPRSIAEWLKENIDGGAVLEQSQLSHIFILDDPGRKKICYEVLLRSFRQFENLALHRNMSFGYKDVPTDQLDARLHLMILRDVTAQWEGERLQQEIRLARKVQIGLLPSTLPLTRGIQLAVECVPAGHIGGDFYDIVALPDGRVAVFVADATGHGMDSALLSAMASGAFRASVYRDARPSSVLKSIDRVLRAKEQPGFITASYLLISKKRDSVSIGLAGHHPPFVVRGITGDTVVIKPSSLPLGVSLKPFYFYEQIPIYKNDLLAVVSDGLLEMQNSTSETYEKQLCDIIVRNSKRMPDDILKQIFWHANAFVSGSGFQDDLTAVVMKVA